MRVVMDKNKDLLVHQKQVGCYEINIPGSMRSVAGSLVGSLGDNKKLMHTTPP